MVNAGGSNPFLGVSLRYTEDTPKERRWQHLVRRYGVKYVFLE